MDTINVVIKKAKSVQGQFPMRSETPFDDRYGFYGVVTEVHPETLTVNVRMDTGREISGVRVASQQWVTMDEEKDYLTGERKLPPVNSFVCCFMPTGEPTSAVVMFSVFAYQDPMGGGITEFKEDSEDAKHIDKKIDNGGWRFTHDKRSGAKRIQNAPKEGDETISLEVDQEEEGNEKATLTIHGNIITVDKENGVRVQTDKNFKQEVAGDFDMVAKGKLGINVDGAITFKSTKTEKLELGNAVASMGAMISDFLQAAISFKSLGSPAAHTAPDFSTAASQIKAKWDQVFK
ncbi:MAG: hypothetical protein LBH43_08450 [Treponema sp.]|jgi:hypothetical protein|nr:hypothetical protein [Treponema sp.]